ncbi:unnamed protein product [Aphanomyces euteiches]
MDGAATNGYLSVVQWLHANRLEKCTEEAIKGAIRYNYVDVVNFLLAHRYYNEASLGLYLRFAAQCGHIELVHQFAGGRDPEDILLALDVAARCGHRECTWFLFQCVGRASPNAIDGAAAEGYLDVIEFLHSHGQPCTENALTKASENGHTSVVAFLIQNRPEGCTPHAIEAAAANGHLHVLQLLSQTPAQCTAQALRRAAAAGHSTVVDFLLATYPNMEWPLKDSIKAAEINGHRNIADNLEMEFVSSGLSKRLAVTDQGPLASSNMLRSA